MYCIYIHLINAVENLVNQEIKKKKIISYTDKKNDLHLH